MAWQTRRTLRSLSYESSNRRRPLGANRECFIRKEHECGKLFSASKSCFIACPTDDDLEPILGLIAEKLTKVGVEPYIAVKERAYGQDIFCTKICGKIIEARFCIVILDDTRVEDKAFPNPNVYYEYGLMTSLRKHIIPLQRQDLALAFNIQSYDTIKYTNKNIGTEIDRAIRDAIRSSEVTSEDQQALSSPEKTILRRLELAGMEDRTDDKAVNAAIVDTSFLGLVHTSGALFCAYVGKLDAEAEVEGYLDDLDVVVYRTENRISQLREVIDRNEKVLDSISNRLVEEEKERAAIYGPDHPQRDVTRLLAADYEASRCGERIASAKGTLSLLDKVYIGFILHPTVNRDELESRARDKLNAYSRYVLACSANDTLSFGDVVVRLGS